MVSLSEYIRIRHISSLAKWLNENDDRKGLHVTDLVYGCMRYARWVVRAREEDRTRNIDEAGLTRLAIGKLIDMIAFGDWHHVDLLYVNPRGHELRGQIDDIIFAGLENGRPVLVVVDKKTVEGIPPKIAHSHYISQVETYIAMLMSGAEIVGVECGRFTKQDLIDYVMDAEAIYGAILYIDISFSTKTKVSDVKILGRYTRSWANERIREINGMMDVVYDPLEEDAEPTPTWFCQYCPIMNECYNNISHSLNVELEGRDYGG